MIVHPVETIGTENLVIAAACVVVLAGTVMATKTKKKSATIEFEVDQEMMPVKKESKKVIKKTLKNILKNNNAKATLIN